MRAGTVGGGSFGSAANSVVEGVLRNERRKESKDESTSVVSKMLGVPDSLRFRAKYQGVVHETKDASSKRSLLVSARWENLSPLVAGLLIVVRE